MVWFVNVTLVNPATGDLVKKQLPVKLNIEGDKLPDMPEVGAAFIDELRFMINEAAKKDEGHKK